MRKHPTRGVFGEAVDAEGGTQVLRILICKAGLRVPEEQRSPAAQSLIDLVSLLVGSVRQR